MLLGAGAPTIADPLDSEGLAPYSVNLCLTTSISHIDTDSFISQAISHIDTLFYLPGGIHQVAVNYATVDCYANVIQWVLSVKKNCVFLSAK